MAAVAAAGAVYLRTERTMAIDELSLCPKMRGPVAITAILFDTTDQITHSQVRSLQQLLDAEIGQAPVGNQFTFGVVTDDPADWGATSPLCKPHGSDDVSQLTQNVRAVQARYDEEFLAPVRDTVARMTTTAPASQSPIMEALQTLVAETPGFITFAGDRKIVIVSDLIQHSDSMSFYRGENWQSFSGSREASRLSETLEGVDVTFLVLPRPHEKIGDPAAVEDFWARYLDRQGANPPTVRRLGDL